MTTSSTTSTGTTETVTTTTLTFTTSTGTSTSMTSTSTSMTSSSSTETTKTGTSSTVTTSSQTTTTSTSTTTASLTSTATTTTPATAAERENLRVAEAQAAVEKLEAAEKDGVLNLLSSMDFSDTSVLQTYLQTDTGTVQVTAILPAAFSEEQQMVLTSGSDARVEVVGHLIQQASEMTSGPIMVSMTSMKDEVAKKFTDRIGSTLRSKPLSLNLRRNDGNPLAMKNLREPLGMVLKVTGEDNVTCAYWDEDEHRWSIEGVTTLGTSNQELRCATTHLSIFAGVVMTFQTLQDTGDIDCEITGSWSVDGIAALYTSDTASRVLGSEWMGSAGGVWSIMSLLLFGLAVAWGVRSQRRQDDEDVKDTLLNRSTGKADMTSGSAVGSCLQAIQGHRSGLELDTLKALNSGVGPHRSRRYSASDDSITRRPSLQEIRRNSNAWDVPVRLQDLPQLQLFVQTFEISRERRRSAEDFLDAPWPGRVVMMFKAVHRWPAVCRFNLFTTKCERICLIGFKILISAAVNALFLSGMPELPDCVADSGLPVFGFGEAVLVGIGSACVADGLRLILLTLREKSKWISWVLWLILVVWGLFCCFAYLATNGAHWLESSFASLFQELLLQPLGLAMFLATRASMALKNPEVIEIVVKKWIETEEAPASPGRQGGEPQQVLQILPTTPAEPAASSRVSHARASLASQEEDGDIAVQIEGNGESSSKREMLEAKSAAYHKAYERAIEDGLGKREAKAMAKEAFRMAQLEESPAEMLLQEAKRQRMAEKSSAYHQAYKEAIEAGKSKAEAKATARVALQHASDGSGGSGGSRPKEEEEEG
eukprot:symbB.v1.2.006372.t1/scaffold371.1/size308833/19